MTDSSNAEASNEGYWVAQSSPSSAQHSGQLAFERAQTGVLWNFTREAMLERVQEGDRVLFLSGGNTVLGRGTFGKVMDGTDERVAREVTVTEVFDPPFRTSAVTRTQPITPSLNRTGPQGGAPGSEAVAREVLAALPELLARPPVSATASVPWAPFYTALGRTLLAYEHDHSTLLKALRDADVSVNHDEGEPLSVMDPLTFMSMLNKHRDEGRLRRILASVGAALGIHVSAPNDFSGLPWSDPRSAWFFPYRSRRRPEDIDALWTIARQAVEGDVRPEAFERALQIPLVGVSKLTSGLFWLNPQDYLPLNSINAAFLERHGIPRAGLATTLGEYRQIMEKVLAMGLSPVELSHQAWMTRSVGGPSAPDLPPSPLPPVDETTGAEDAEASDTTPLPAEPLNLLLYGPPGTGKTYTVIEEALKRLDPAFLAASPSREAQQLRFAELQAEGRAVFTTFHQSFSYEDFVEGIKPVTTESGEVTYALEDGVFKTLALRASSPVAEGQIADLNLAGRVWKLSLDGTDGFSAVREYCLAHDEARVGYTDLPRLDEAPDLKGAARQFVEGLQEGDLVLVPGPRTTVQAVGVVTGPYRYDETPPPGVPWRNVRPVRWLAKGLAVPFKDLLGVNFTLTTLYGLKIGVPQALAHLARHGVPLGPRRQAPQSHVLIIDEINRGNVAKILGELITLLEPSKRAGAAEATTVTLPYSKAPFAVPANLFVIGTMNTADRSLARLDTALRRRFEFRELPPRPELLAVTRDGVHLRKLLYALNRRVTLLLDRDHALGHALLMGLNAESTVEDVARAFRSRVLPLLEEYFFEDWERIALVLNDPAKAPEDRIVVKQDDGAAWLPEARGTLRAYRVQDAALTRLGAYTGIYEGEGGAPLPFPQDVVDGVRA